MPRLGDFLAPHQFIELSHQHTLDRPGRHLFVNPVFLQEIADDLSILGG
jgi:hypothetical protein